MSAYIVSDKSISVIVKMLVSSGTLQEVEAVSFGQMMLNLNTYSVNYRYEENSEVRTFEYSNPELVDGPETFIKVIVLIDEYNYQTCEFCEYNKTLVRRVLEDLKHVLMDAYIAEQPYPSDWKYKKSYELPGYYEAMTCD